MHQAAQGWYIECIARLDTRFNTFEQEAEAAAQWREHCGALRQEGRQYVAKRDQEAKAIHDECLQAEAKSQQIVQEAKDRDSEMQIALAAVGGGQRALISEHDLCVCGLRTEMSEANECVKRLRSELNESASTSCASRTWRVGWPTLSSA